LGPHSTVAAVATAAASANAAASDAVHSGANIAAKATPSAAANGATAALLQLLHFGLLLHVLDMVSIVTLQARKTVPVAAGPGELPGRYDELSVA